MDDLKINTANTGITAALSDISNNEVRTPRFDIDAAPKKWTPETNRDQRIADNADNDKFIPYDADTNHLCGGDFVFNEKGEAATISFLFEGTDGRRYGLTVAHLCPQTGQGSCLFAYTKDSGILIGKVAEFHMGTDSLIFRLCSGIRADLYTIRLSDDIKHKIDLSTSVSAMKNLESKIESNKGDLAFDIVFIGRGARYRGTKGRYSSIWTHEPTADVCKGDIGTKSIRIDAKDDNGLRAITREGDCGMIVLNENGEPLSMHHAMGIGEFEGTKYHESYSVPLFRIMKAHSRYFPRLEDNDKKGDGCKMIVKTSPERAPLRRIPSIRSPFCDGKPYGLVRTGRGSGESRARARIDMSKFKHLIFESSKENI